MACEIQNFTILFSKSRVSSLIHMHVPPCVCMCECVCTAIWSTIQLDYKIFMGNLVLRSVIEFKCRRSFHSMNQEIILKRKKKKTYKEWRGEMCPGEQCAQKPYFSRDSSKEISKNIIFIDTENIFIEIFCRWSFADNIPEYISLSELSCIFNICMDVCKNV